MMFSQTSIGLIDYLPESEFETLSTSASSKLEQMRRNPAYRSITPIRVKNVRDIQSELGVPLQLPDVAQPVFLKGKLVNQKTNGDLDWYGEISEGADGWMSLFKRSSEVFGSLTYKGRNFSTKVMVK